MSDSSSGSLGDMHTLAGLEDMDWDYMDGKDENDERMGDVEDRE